MDLFAININTKFAKYAAFRLDPRAMYIVEFSLDCSYLKFYAFLPISVIPRVLLKVKQDSAKRIIVVPFWKTQVWYLVIFQMLVPTPILLDSRKSLLVLPQTTNQVHPMREKVNMLVVLFVSLFTESKSLSRDAFEIFMRVSTRKRYNSHMKRFVKLCRE